METFIKFISEWAKAVVSGFSEYPLAASIVTLIAVIAYVVFWKIKKSMIGRRVVCFFSVF